MTMHKNARETLLNIAEGLYANIGEKFFYSLTEHLVNILKVDYAYIAEIRGDNLNRAKTLSLYADGKVLENIEVDLKGTPCEIALKENICSIPFGVTKKFPHASVMVSMSVEGYCGITLLSGKGRKIGLLSVMHRKPLKNLNYVKSMIQIFASRAASELERIQYEEALQKAKNELEIRVRERTAELEKINKILLTEIKKRRRIEIELKEKNVALKVLLKQREEDKEELGQNILSNIKSLVQPYLIKLKRIKLKSNECTYINIIEENLNEIISPFSHKLSSNLLKLSPKEIQIAHLIRDGKRDKDIAEILNLSLDTIKAHRKNIRKKLNIYNKRENLRTVLLSLFK
jgi:DNA-binding CsgD family transcriptional regulator